MPDNPDSVSKFLFVALIVPDARRRHALAEAIAGSPNAIAREFGDNPMRSDPSEFARLGCDIAIVDLDEDIDHAVRVIESISGRNPATTVMACSGRNDLSLVRRAMQAGARDFLLEPILTSAMTEVLARVSSRRASEPPPPRGKLLTFASSKGGVGVTSIASNFAVALARESGARVAIVDMDLQRGDVALGLGLTATCSVADALKNPGRLDSEFLSTLLMPHESGLAVLGSPEGLNFADFPAEEGMAKLFQIMREEFDYVVVDSGTCHGHLHEQLFAMHDKLYLVTERSFPSLRNANRLISQLSTGGPLHNLEIVLNRSDLHSDIDENLARKAMGRGVNWKIPNAHAAVRKARDRGVPLAMKDSPITAAIVQMARAACGKSMNTQGKRLFGLFGRKPTPSKEAPEQPAEWQQVPDEQPALMRSVFPARAIPALHRTQAAS